MRHHKHLGHVGRLDKATDRALTPHPDTLRDDARLVWLPIAGADGREIEALEGVTCVPSRSGAMRIVAVPHVAVGLALGDELATGIWNGEPLARGELACALNGTIRCLAKARLDWVDIAQYIDAAVGVSGECWFDVIGEHALAASVPRQYLGTVFAALEQYAAIEAAADFRWEYVTADRH